MNESHDLAVMIYRSSRVSERPINPQRQWVILDCAKPLNAFVVPMRCSYHPASGMSLEAAYSSADTLRSHLLASRSQTAEFQSPGRYTRHRSAISGIDSPSPISVSRSPPTPVASGFLSARFSHGCHTHSPFCFQEPKVEAFLYKHENRFAFRHSF